MFTHKVTITSRNNSKVYYYPKSPNKLERSLCLSAFKIEFGKCSFVEISVSLVNLKKIE